MAEIKFTDGDTINVGISEEKKAVNVSASSSDLDYIPGYKAAEAERRANEEERIAYYEDFQQRVGNGEFKGEPGPAGPPGEPGKDGTMTFEELTEEQKASLKGEPGKDGYTPIKGVDYFDGKDAPKYTAGTNIEITEDNVINCTATGGGGTLTEELDPTVPQHVKNITEESINSWNGKVDHTYLNALLEEEYTSKDEFNETVDAIITEFATALEDTTSAIPTNTSQLTNDSGFVTEDTNTTYTLSKDGSTVKLTGSDGSSSEVTVTEGGGSTEYDVATSTTDGLMSASDKSKLDGISAGANKTTVDSALSSSSTNPVQNKVVNSALLGKQSKVLSGTGVPSDSTGSDGDVYFQTVYEDTKDIYSLQETVIGEWIDGKPIYRTVVHLGTPNVKYNTYNHGIENMDVLIKVYGRFYRPGATHQIIPNTYTNWETWVYDVGESVYTLKFSDNQWNAGVTNCQIIFEYTKTTD